MWISKTNFQITLATFYGGGKKSVPDSTVMSAPDGACCKIRTFTTEAEIENINVFL